MKNDERPLVVLPPPPRPYPDGTVLSFTPADIDACVELSVRRQFGIHGASWGVTVTRSPDGSRLAIISKKDF